MEKEIFVHIDLGTQTYFVGTLWIYAKKGRETATFSYSRDWLNSNMAFSLEPMLQLGEAPFYSNKALFGSIGDSAPDRWGRVLMKRNELLKAKDEERTPKTLLESDYLLQVCDFARQGALRFSETRNGQAPRVRPPL